MWHNNLLTMGNYNCLQLRNHPTLNDDYKKPHYQKEQNAQRQQLLQQRRLRQQQPKEKQQLHQLQQQTEEEQILQLQQQKKEKLEQLQQQKELQLLIEEQMQRLQKLQQEHNQLFTRPTIATLVESYKTALSSPISSLDSLYSSDNDNKVSAKITSQEPTASATLHKNYCERNGKKESNFEIDNLVNFIADSSDGSEKSSTSDSENDIYYDTSTTFSEDIIQNFSDAGGKLVCCNNCNDYLDIPAGAIEVNADYEIIQQFPFICCHDEKDGDYHVVCVKKYQERENCSFKSHVCIVCNFILDLNDQQHVGIRVRYSTDNGNYEEALLLNDSTENCFLPDVYYKIRKNTLTIFTTHFTVFIVEEEVRPSASRRVFSKCLKQRFVDLICSAYISVDYEERNILLHIYVEDIKHKKYKDVKRNIDSCEAKCGNQSYFEWKLTNLPDIITRSTEFQCLLFLCRSKWKRILSTVTFELEDITDDDAEFLKIEMSSDLGKISYDSLRACDILSYKIKPLLGDFKLTYKETEHAFIPLIIIKTSTPVSLSQNLQLTQQPTTMRLFFSQEMQVSMSRVNGKEIKLYRQFAATNNDNRSKMSINQNDKAEKDSDLISRSVETNYELKNAACCGEILSGPKFHGLLSDSGLFQMADYIGAEWNELAFALNVPYRIQNIIQLDNPYNTRKQIADMLRWWRDRQTDEEPIVKDKLRHALGCVGKVDVVDQLMKNQL